MPARRIEELLPVFTTCVVWGGDLKTGDYSPCVRRDNRPNDGPPVRLQRTHVAIQAATRCEGGGRDQDFHHTFGNSASLGALLTQSPLAL